MLAVAIGLVFGGATMALSAGTLTSTAGSTLTQVQVVRDANPATTSSTDFVDVPGATTSVTIPAGTTGLILARFSASSTCPGELADASCFVRILIGDKEARPSGVNISTLTRGRPRTAPEVRSRRT